MCARVCVCACATVSQQRYILSVTRQLYSYFGDFNTGVPLGSVEEYFRMKSVSGQISNASRKSSEEFNMGQTNSFIQFHDTRQCMSEED